MSCKRYSRTSAAEYEAASAIPRLLYLRLRRSAEEALRAGRITLEESARLMRAYRHGLNGYTYLQQGVTGLWE